MNIRINKDPILSRFTKIYINDILHLAIDRSKLIGLQTWKNDTNNVSVYYVEFYFDGEKSIRSEYNEIDKFKKIMELLDNALD